MLQVTKNIRNGKLIKLPMTLSLDEIEQCDVDVIPLLLSLYGYLEPLKVLINNGLDPVTCLNTDSDNLFLMACYGHHQDVINYLLEQQMSPIYCNIYGETGLMFACNKTHPLDIGFITYLLDLGVNPNKTTIDNQNVLHYLHNTSDPLPIAKLLQEHIQPQSSTNIISFYCYYDSYDLVELFINKFENRHIFSSFFWAILNNNKKLYDLLTLRYPEVNISQIQEGNLNMFQIILNVFVHDDGDESLAKWAILDHIATISNPKYVNNAGVSSMIIAALTGNLQLVDYLYNVYDLKLVQRNKLYNNMYTIAMSNEAYQTVKYLALHGLYMEYENIQYIVYKNNRFYNDIYTLYFNFINNINVILNDNGTIHILRQHGNDTVNINEPSIDLECVICKEKFVHLDDVLMCCNKHTYHPHCMLLQASNKIVGYLDCLVCFQELIARPENLYVYFDNPTTDNINTYINFNNMSNESFSVKEYKNEPLVNLEVPKRMIPFLTFSNSKNYNSIQDLNDNLDLNYKNKNFFWYTTFNYTVDDIDINEDNEDNDMDEDVIMLNENIDEFNDTEDENDDMKDNIDKLSSKLNDPYLKDIMYKRIMEYFIMKKRNVYKKCY